MNEKFRRKIINNRKNMPRLIEKSVKLDEEKKKKRIYFHFKEGDFFF